MKLQIASDLHVDMTSSYFEVEPGVTHLILAGDIANGLDKMEEFLMELHSYHPHLKILYVPGNHDYIGFDPLMEDRTRLFKKTSGQVQRLGFYEDDDVCIVGDCLWSNLETNYKTEHVFAQMCYRQFYECSEIKNWSPHRMIETHINQRKVFERFADTDVQGKIKIAVSHFAPSNLSIHEQYKDAGYKNSYFCNRMDSIVEKYDFWIHGHLHNSFDYQIGKCRVIANPRGYYASTSTPENPDYKNLVLIIER